MYMNGHPGASGARSFSGESDQPSLAGLADSDEAMSYIDFYRSNAGYRERTEMYPLAAKLAVKKRVAAIKTAAQKKAAALASLRKRYAAALAASRVAYSQMKKAKTAAIKAAAQKRYAAQVAALKSLAKQINAIVPGSIKAITGTTSKPAPAFSPGLLALAASYYLFM